MRTDLELVEFFQSGDETAFEELVKRHRAKVFNMARQMVDGNAMEADDLSQEVFLRVYRGLKTFRKTASFSTWLYRIVVNCCQDYLRSQSRKPVNYLEDLPAWQGDAAVANFSTQHIVNPEKEAEKKELKEQMKAALALLPPQYRTAIILFAWQGLTYREIAVIMKCPIGTIMSRLNFARKKIRESLGNFLEEGE